MPKPKQTHQNYGKTLMNARFKGQKVLDDGSIHNANILNTSSKLNTKSITQESNLDEFLRSAELANKDFTSKKLNARILTNPNSQLVDDLLPSKKQNDETLKQHHENKHILQIPKRPQWTSEMSKEDVDQNEKEVFLGWRRNLTIFQQNHNLNITPYELNLEVWRQLWRVIERSDVCVQIVDARNPLLYRCEDLVSYVNTFENKKNLMILNKADLLTEDQRQVWKRYFADVGVDFAFFSAIDTKEYEEEKVCALPKNTEQIYNSKQLTMLFETFCQESSSTVIGLMGYPNVGKSSTINSLMQKKSVSVGSMPGKTKHFQTLVLNEKIMLCDCPGLVFPSFVVSNAEMVCYGILPVDNMLDYTTPTAYLCNHIPKEHFERTYNIKVYSDKLIKKYGRSYCLSPEHLLNSYATSRGYFKAGQGNPDQARAAKYILKNYIDGKLLYNKPPPSFDSEKDFNVNIYTPEKKATETSSKNAYREEDSETSNKTESSLDKKFFGKKEPKANMVGKFGMMGFARSSIYPHQRTVNNDGTLATPEQTSNLEHVYISKNNGKGNKGRK